jgi:hypothetical protein
MTRRLCEAWTKLGMRWWSIRHKSRTIRSETSEYSFKEDRDGATFGSCCGYGNDMVLEGTNLG